MLVCTVSNIELVLTRITPMQAIFRDYTLRTHAPTYKGVPYGTVNTVYIVILDTETHIVVYLL